ncbi:MAG: FHA domain-containing protein, partial [Gemmatimonadaceae bacterium]
APLGSPVRPHLFRRAHCGTEVSAPNTSPPDFPTGGIIVSREGTVVQTAPLGNEPLTIGRLPQSRLVLNDSSVSRYHAEVRLEGGEATLTDVGSSGGTFVGDEQLPPQQPRRLTPGASFRIGSFDLTYVAPTPRRAEAPVTPAAVSSEATRPGVLVESKAESKGDAKGAAKKGGRAARESAAGASDARPPEPPDPPETIIAFPKRPRFPVPPPADARSRYLRYMPGLFHDADFLGRMLLIFESMWEPLEWRQNHIHVYFDPRTAPSEFLGWLASWLGLTLDKHWPEERRRLLLTEAMELYRWRGTLYGLGRMLEVCTGLTATITEEPDRQFVMRVRVRIPKDSYVRSDMIERLIQVHKPAHVGYVLEVSS